MYFQQDNPNKRGLSMIKQISFFHVIFADLMGFMDQTHLSGIDVKVSLDFINSCFVLNHRLCDHSSGFDINYPFKRQQ